MHCHIPCTYTDELLFFFSTTYFSYFEDWEPKCWSINGAVGVTLSPLIIKDHRVDFCLRCCRIMTRVMLLHAVVLRRAVLRAVWLGRQQLHQSGRATQSSKPPDPRQWDGQAQVPVPGLWRGWLVVQHTHTHHPAATDSHQSTEHGFIRHWK